MKSETAKKRRKNLTEQGLCYSCGKCPHTSTSKRCEPCCQKIKLVNKNWRKTNPEEYKKVCRESVRKERLVLRKKLLEKLGGKCECCGNSTYEFLQFDHVNRDGKQHRAKVKSNV